MSSSVTAVLTDYLTGARLQDLPDDVIRQAKRTLLNFIGCAVGGAFDDSVNATMRALAPFAGAPQATVLGRRDRYDPLLAALLNGMSSAVYSFDDTHAQAVVHPGGPVASAMLAYAETQPVSGADFLLAYALGVEVVCRVSKAVSVAPATPALNWIQTGICAGIGAAAAVGKLMKLDTRKLAWAIGIAAAQAAGIRGLSRSMCFSLMAGQAARSGLAAALLAREGFTSADDPLGAKQGFADSYSGSANLAAIADDLGRRFEILDNTFKPYPCGIVIHPVIDACLDLVGSNPVAAEQVERIVLTLNPTSASLADIRHPGTPSEAQMSAQHWAAAALLDRRAGLRQSRPDRIADPGIAALRDKVEIVPQADFARESAAIAIDLADGTVLRGTVPSARGSAARPMTDQDIEDKFRLQCADHLSEDRIAALATRIWSLGDLPDSAEIATLAVGQA